MKKIKILILLLFFTLPLFSSNITFKGGYTKVSMMEGLEKITLQDEARVEIDNKIEIQSNTIELIGKEFDIINCIDNVLFVDKENKLTIHCKSLSYNRITNTITIKGWVEVEDLKNNLNATASYLEFNTENQLMKLKVEVTLLHLSDNKLMKCTCDTLQYDRENQSLILLGNSYVELDEDVYKAQAITVDLKTNDISMEGSIEGTIKNTN